MIGAIVLLEIAAAAIAPPRAPVAAAPTELSTVASKIQINRKALEGWVPVKGTPVPVAPLPDVVYVPERAERHSRPAPEIVENESSSYEEESVNSFTGDRPWFYGNGPALPPHAGRHPGGGGGRPHPAPRAGSPRTQASAQPAPHAGTWRTGPGRRGVL